VYVDYWHFDEGEIADWAVLWNSMPWEVTVAMEKAVMDGKVSFSRSGATSKNVNWLSLIIPNDANIIKGYLQEFKKNNYIPEALNENNQNLKYYQDRYDSSIKWIENNNHAVISNGPFYLESYAPESRTITVRAFDDDSYPFKIDKWKEFEDTKFPMIEKIEMERIIQKDEGFQIEVEAENTDFIRYFLINSEGKITSTETIKINEKNTIITLSSEKTKELGIGANNIKIFAISDSVLKPDFYESSFIVTKEKIELPINSIDDVKFIENNVDYKIWIIPIIVIIGSIIYIKKRSQ
jgi:peptide/nickel transport system substrate-binding protein